MHEYTRRAAPIAIIALLGAAAACAGSASVPPATVQRADAHFDLPDTGPPEFAAGSGPRVGVDEAHNNYHTAGGRYRAFAQLLERDGYRVGPFVQALTAESLGNVDALVISNAIATENQAEWALPNHSAFTEAEIAAAVAWVESGGNLLLIADHMPMPGAAAALARAFGVLFHDGYAFNADGTGIMTFSKDNGRLLEHPVTEDIPFVTTFTGQAFRLAPGAEGQPLMVLEPGARMLLPRVAAEFDATTPRIPADGLLQGLLLERGGGRVAMFGEAAAFSAQISTASNPMGMNHPDAAHNARFLLNVMRWLTVEQIPSLAYQAVAR